MRGLAQCLFRSRLIGCLGFGIVLAGCSTPQAIAPSTPPAQSTLPEATLPATSTPTDQITRATATLPATATALPPAETAPAIQTVLDYYSAINARDYEAAYNLWRDNGAASQQSLDQFQRAFASTVQASVVIDDARPAASAIAAIDVPAMITSITNTSAPNGEQQVQHVRATYTLQSADDADRNVWRITNVVLETDPSDQPASRFRDPLELVRAYYDAINNGVYAQAYTDWNNLGRASQQSLGEFEAGFAATDRVAIELGAAQNEGAAGSIYATVPIVISATHHDGSQHAFCGTYTLRRLNVPPFDQLGWRIERAQIAPIPQPDAQQAQQLLSTGCAD